MEIESQFNPEQNEKRIKKPYEAIVVMPYGSDEYIRGRKSKIAPSLNMTYETKMVLLAALQAYEQGQSEKIILLGEQTYGNPEHHTDEFMKEFLIAKGVPETNIVSHDGLNNSYTQLEKLAEIQNLNEKFLVISLQFHKPRVEQTSKNLAVAADHKSGEELLNERSPHFGKVIENWDQTQKIKKEKLIENLLVRPVSALDTKGILQKYLGRSPRKPFNAHPKDK